jgi:hypothetical protein
MDKENDWMLIGVKWIQKRRTTESKENQDNNIEFNDLFS